MQLSPFELVVLRRFYLRGDAYLRTSDRSSLEQLRNILRYETCSSSFGECFRRSSHFHC